MNIFISYVSLRTLLSHMKIFLFSHKKTNPKRLDSKTHSIATTTTALQLKQHSIIPPRRIMMYLPQNTTVLFIDFFLWMNDVFICIYTNLWPRSTVLRNYGWPNPPPAPPPSPDPVIFSSCQRNGLESGG